MPKPLEEASTEMTFGVKRKRRTSSELGLHREGRCIRVLQRKHAQDIFRFSAVSHRMRVRCHRQARDRHQIRSVVIDRDDAYRPNAPVRERWICAAHAQSGRRRLTRSSAPLASSATRPLWRCYCGQPRPTVRAQESAPRPCCIDNRCCAVS